MKTGTVADIANQHEGESDEYEELGSKPLSAGASQILRSLTGGKNIDNWDQEGFDADKDPVEDDDEDVIDTATEEEAEAEEEEQPEATTEYARLKEKLVPVLGQEGLDTPEAIESALDDLILTKQDYEKDKQMFENITNLFDQHDDMVQVAKLLSDGYTFNEALARTIDFEAWQSELKDSDPDEYRKVLKRQMEREQDRQQREQAMTANKEESSKNWRSFLEERGMEPKQADEFSQQISQHFDNVINGKVTQDFLDVMYRGLNYEKDVQEAKQKGKVEGANKAISEGQAKTRGDGTPTLRSGGARQTDMGKPVSRGKQALGRLIQSRQSQSDWR